MITLDLAAGESIGIGDPVAIVPCRVIDEARTLLGASPDESIVAAAMRVSIAAVDAAKDRANLNPGQSDLRDARNALGASPYESIGDAAKRTNAVARRAMNERDAARSDLAEARRTQAAAMLELHAIAGETLYQAARRNHQHWTHCDTRLGGRVKEVEEMREILGATVHETHTDVARRAVNELAATRTLLGHAKADLVAINAKLVASIDNPDAIRLRLALREVHAKLSCRSWETTAEAADRVVAELKELYTLVGGLRTTLGATAGADVLDMARWVKGELERALTERREYANCIDDVRAALEASPGEHVVEVAKRTKAATGERCDVNLRAAIGRLTAERDHADRCVVKLTAERDAAKSRTSATGVAFDMNGAVLHLGDLVESGLLRALVFDHASVTGCSPGTGYVNVANGRWSNWRKVVNAPTHSTGGGK